MRAAVVTLFATLSVACASPSTRPAATPTAPSPAAEPAPDAAPPSSLEQGLPPAPRGTPPAPGQCAAYVAAATPACSLEPDAVRAALADALSAEGERRDADLAALESCTALPLGVVRALRVELAPAECGDALVDPFLRARGSELTADLRHTLAGLGLAGRLTRLVRTAPRLEPPFTKERFERFFRTELAGWVQHQAHAIHQTSLVGAGLLDYGKAIVAVEAGLADMRFVEVARSVPIPDELSKEADLAEAYYAALDEALEPRKARGRDAALVGLRQFAKLGVIADPRVAQARQLLTQVFSGSRVDALDGLLVPELPPTPTETVEQRLAAALPTFYVPHVLPQLRLDDPALLRALLVHGLPASAASAAEGSPDPALRALYARGLFELGRTYWQSAAFARVEEVLGKQADPGLGGDLLSALARSLRAGPRDVAELMLQGPLLPASLAEVSALDAVSRSASIHAGMAAYDAGYLMSLVPQTEPSRVYLEGIVERFKRAEKQLKDPQHKALARDRAKAAEQTLAALKRSAR